MEITWYGLSCFRLAERGLASVVADPFDPSLGLQEVKLRGDIVTISADKPAHNHVNIVKGKRRVIQRPGEYEIGGVFIIGILMTPKDGKKKKNQANMLYVFDFDGLTVAHLGNLSYVPSQAEIENLGAVDIALVPVGGGGALTPSQAAEVISLIEPSIVVPMHYKTVKEGPKLGTVARFLSEMGTAKLDPLPSLKIRKGGLSSETQVVVLEAAT
ncbi:MAG TPA: MBL fold metallo-hydrolase [Anaerolineae bacterium]|nr:MBL fold metallo-hydrolase [Anaerolineae bacterium]